MTDKATKNNQETESCTLGGRARRVAIFLQEIILIVFEFIWKVLLSNRNFVSPLGLPLTLERLIQDSNELYGEQSYQ